MGARTQVDQLTVPSGFACPHALARDLDYQLSRQLNVWGGELFVRPDAPPVALSASASFRQNFGGWFGGVVGFLMCVPLLYLGYRRAQCVPRGRVRGAVRAARARAWGSAT